MRTTALTAAATAALVLTLVGCSAAPASDSGKMPDTAPVASPSSTPETTPTEESEFGERVMNSRGNLVKELGQLAGTTGMVDDDLTTSRFAVTDIVLDPECTSGFSDAPQNGHYLGIHLNIETTPELADEAFPWVSFSSYDWQAYDAEGKRLNDPNGNAWSCFDSTQTLPVQIGPGQSVSGWIVLDVAAPTGSVVLAMGGSPTGWEWAY